MLTTVDLVNSIQAYLLGKYSGRGKDLHEIRSDGEMDQGDAEQYQFILDAMAV